jgi:hypothetical protein
MTEREWLLFTPQIPAFPSSVRVMVWRRLQHAGAVSLQNGVWILPRSPEHERFMCDLFAEVERQGGSGFILTSDAADSTFHARIVTRFQAEREQEYAEFTERCGEFLQEIEKETQAQKFTFAELEENEHDLLKLTSWLRKIQRRDFFRGARSEEASHALARCRSALEAFTATVYTQAGLEPGHAQGSPQEEG